MHNISALGTDGLVMRHAYVMHHTGLETRFSGSVTGDHVGYQVKTSLTETKSRLGALPYGFGLTDLDLTSKQKAIIAALGLAKQRRW